jgi:hypothetical protein
MANSITSFAAKNPESLDVVYNCGLSAEDGTISYKLPIDNEDLKNPLKLIQFLRDNPNFTAFAVSFVNCRVRACGDYLTLNGPASLRLGVSAADLLGKKIPARFSLLTDGLTAEGFINGTLVFGYVINAAYTQESLDSVEIEESDPAKPLTWEGKTYQAKDIADLSDGC